MAYHQSREVCMVEHAFSLTASHHVLTMCLFYHLFLKVGTVCIYTVYVYCCSFNLLRLALMMQCICLALHCMGYVLLILLIIFISKSASFLHGLHGVRSEILSKKDGQCYLATSSSIPLPQPGWVVEAEETLLAVSPCIWTVGEKWC